jgi:hypothetical protein
MEEELVVIMIQIPARLEALEVEVLQLMGKHLSEVELRLALFLDLQ